MVTGHEWWASTGQRYHPSHSRLFSLITMYGTPFLASYLYPLGQPLFRGLAAPRHPRL